MEVKNFYGIMELKAETHQGGNQNIGSISPINQQDIMWENERHQIPVISGNSIRGLLRRLIFTDLLDRLDLKLSNMDVFHALFNGGNLSSSGTPRFDLKFRKQMIEIAPFHLLGFAIGNSMIQSNLKVKQALLCCQENQSRVILEHKPFCQKAAHEYLNTTFFTRKDSSKGELVKYLVTNVTESQAESAAQMKIEEYVLIPGTKFQIGFSIINPTEMELSCLYHMINLWKEYGVIGGKSQKGYGEIELSIPEIDSKTEQVEDSNIISSALYLNSIKKTPEIYLAAIESLYAKVKNIKKEKNIRKKVAKT